MQIRLLDHDHLQFGPVTVDLAHNYLLALLCRLISPGEEAAQPQRPPFTRTSCH
jgi:hypothetical protein